MATANTKAALICVRIVPQKRCVHKMPSAKNRDKAYLAAFCRDGWGCTTYTFVQGHLQAKTTKNRACVCRCKRKARYALYAIQRLGSGYQLGELKFAAMNLKKLATWKWKRKNPSLGKKRREISSMDFLSALIFFPFEMKKSVLAWCLNGLFLQAEPVVLTTGFFGFL